MLKRVTVLIQVGTGASCRRFSNAGGEDACIIEMRNPRSGSWDLVVKVLRGGIENVNVVERKESGRVRLYLACFSRSASTGLPRPEKMEATEGRQRQPLLR